VRFVHWNEVRDRINALRAQVNLPAVGDAPEWPLSAACRSFRANRLDEGVCLRIHLRLLAQVVEERLPGPQGAADLRHDPLHANTRVESLVLCARRRWPLAAARRAGPEGGVAFGTHGRGRRVPYGPAP